VCRHRRSPPPPSSATGGAPSCAPRRPSRDRGGARAEISRGRGREGVRPERRSVQAPVDVGARLTTGRKPRPTVGMTGLPLQRVCRAGPTPATCQSWVAKACSALAIAMTPACWCVQVTPATSNPVFHHPPTSRRPVLIGSTRLSTTAIRVFHRDDLRRSTDAVPQPPSASPVLTLRVAPLGLLYRRVSSLQVTCWLHDPASVVSDPHGQTNCDPI
jgi:hypothetical protein